MIYRSNIVYVDPTDPRDVLTAVPAEHDGNVYPVIGVTHGITPDEGLASGIVNSGSTQSVCIRPGDEKAVLSDLGNQLLGLKGDDRVLVVTRQEIEAFRDDLKERYRETDTVYFAINDLIDRVTDAMGSQLQPA